MLTIGPNNQGNSNNQYSNNATNGNKSAAAVPTYGSIQKMMFNGAERIDKKLRTQAVEKNDKARNRRPQEIVYEWLNTQGEFTLRFYTGIDTSTLNFRALRTRSRSAKMRVIVSDRRSKQIVKAAGGVIEVNLDNKTEVVQSWENRLANLLERAFLFIWRQRPRCPVCREQKMEIRQGKSGEFWGCTGFPKCRGTKKIENVHPSGGFANEGSISGAVVTSNNHTEENTTAAGD